MHGRSCSASRGQKPTLAVVVPQHIASCECSRAPTFLGQVSLARSVRLRSQFARVAVIACFRQLTSAMIVRSDSRTMCSGKRSSPAWANFFAVKETTKPFTRRRSWRWTNGHSKQSELERKRLSANRALARKGGRAREGRKPVQLVSISLELREARSVKQTPFSANSM